jgi:hypothetical protein
MPLVDDWLLNIEPPCDGAYLRGQVSAPELYVQSQTTHQTLPMSSFAFVP